MIISRLNFFILFFVCIMHHVQGGNRNGRVQDIQNSTDPASNRQNEYTVRRGRRRNATVERPREGFVATRQTHQGRQTNQTFIPVVPNDQSADNQRVPHNFDVTVNVSPSQFRNGRATVVIRQFVGTLTVEISQSGPSNVV